MQSSTQKSLVQKLSQHLATERAFKAGGTGFTVKHYAGDVSYDADGMIEKNRDALPETVSDLLRGSRVALVRQFFSDGGGGGGGGAVSSRDTSSEHFALNASSCNGANLKWAYSKDAQHIVSMYSHKCLEANTSSGAGQMLQNSCDPNTLTQKWLVSPEVFSPGGAGGTIVLVSAGTDGGTGAHEGSRWNATSMCLSSFQCPAAGC